MSCAGENDTRRWLKPALVLFATQRFPAVSKAIPDGKFSDPELDVMLEEQRQITDRDERLAKIDEIQRFVLEQGGMVPLYSPGWNWILASPASVQGFQFAPFNRALLYDVSIAQ